MEINYAPLVVLGQRARGFLENLGRWQTPPLHITRLLEMILEICAPQLIVYQHIQIWYVVIKLGVQARRDR